ncbi:MAG: hypothetical protein LIP12_04030, partial [Clostridiales bacterium]|nr:hypothetical protein [Clostridiales bacterium]
IIFKLMLPKIDFNRFYSSLKKLLSELSSELHVISLDAILEEMGFPQNWEDIKGPFCENG